MKKLLTAVILIILNITVTFAATETFIDNFNTVSYANNNGTSLFSGNWDEYEPYATNNDPTAGYIYVRSNALYFYYIYGETITRELNLAGAASVTLTFNLASNQLSADIQDVQLRNADNTWVTIFSITDTTPTGIKSYLLDSQFIHTTSAIRFIARDNWNSNDRVYIDDITFTADFVDTDNDGVLNNIDVDDDNDGILDVNEVSSQSDSYSNADGGGAHTYNYNFTDRSTLTIDIATLNNAFNVTVDGTTLLANGQILDAENTTGRSQLVFLTSGGASGTTINNPATANSNGLPRVRVYIDDAGTVRLYGTRETTSTLLELLQTGDGSTFNTFVPVTGNREIVVTNIDDVGTDGLSATNIIRTNVDNDGDGIVNSLDLDSDNDGIPDNVEAQSTGSYIAPSGTVDAATGLDTAYPTTGLLPIDTDLDGINDVEDSDSDDDLITDCLESYDTATSGITPSCPVNNANVGNNGFVTWAEVDDTYGTPNGVITNPTTVLLDEIIGNTEVAYREAACGAAAVTLTAFQWKTVSFPCDLGTNGVEAILGGPNGLGTYGDNANWVMYEQTDLTTGTTTMMSATDPVVPGKGYWIIADQTKTVGINGALAGISKTGTQPSSNFPGIPATGVAFSDVTPYSLPNSDAVNPLVIFLGNPFFKKFQLSDVYYQNVAKDPNYVSMATLVTITDPMEPVVYIKDSADISNGNYTAITATPGFTDVVPPMQGFWIKLNAGNTNANNITYPFER